MSELPMFIDKKSECKALLFDLGGVIYHIDPELTAKLFQKKIGDNYFQFLTTAEKEDIFNKFEIGEVSSEYFLTRLSEISEGKLTKDDVFSIWNKMIVNIPTQHLVSLKRLSLEKPIYLLSNTNSIHVDFINRQLKNIGMYDLYHQVFTKIYYSYQIKARKPHKEAFEYVLNDCGLKPQEICFLDDKQENIDSAKNAKIDSFLFPFNGDLTKWI